MRFSICGSWQLANQTSVSSTCASKCTYDNLPQSQSLAAEMSITNPVNEMIELKLELDDEQQLGPPQGLLDMHPRSQRICVYVKEKSVSIV